MSNLKLGELLLRAKVLKEGQLHLALSEQKRLGGRLGETLVRLSLITEDLLLKALSRQLGLPVADLDAIRDVPAEAKVRLPYRLAASLEAVPLRLGDAGKLMVVAMAEPQNAAALDKLRSETRCRISPQLATRASVTRALRRFYSDQDVGELPDMDNKSFRVIDAQGMLRDLEGTPVDSPHLTESGPPPESVRHASSTQVEAAPISEVPMDLVKGLEEVQRKEVVALKAMVELLIEKRVFTRDEYLAKVKR